MVINSNRKSNLFLRLILIFFFVLVNQEIQGQQSNYLSVKPLPGDGILTLLSRYAILDSCNKQFFYLLNDMEIDQGLNLGKFYQLPIRVYDYNGTSIRSSIGINNYKQAKRIELFNDHLLKKGVKSADFREELLWVPENLIQCYDEDRLPEYHDIPEPVETKAPTVVFPLLGKKDEVIDIRGDQLRDHVYYLVSGHGGPDPGAIGVYNGCNLCEDEYAYDVTLRLANNLIRYGAKVYVIVQDENDDIQNEAILPCDEDETCYGGAIMPRNQLKRLKQRTDVINNLYRHHQSEGNKIQRLMIFHVDSRQVDERVDMYFYHAYNSRSGKNMADNLRQHIEEKYGYFQKTRGYNGRVRTRNLYMLNNTLPTTVYVELGNIHNQKDQKRFILQTNRQAIANWFTEGILAHEEAKLAQK